MKKVYSTNRTIDPKERAPRFWCYGQNNSGGSFDYDKARGIGHYVIVEAFDDDHADSIAESIGLYFDGNGDCSCCGTRWSQAYGKGDDVPSRYGTPIEDDEDDWRFDSPKGQPYVFVHYLNGVIEGWS